MKVRELVKALDDLIASDPVVANLPVMFDAPEFLHDVVYLQRRSVALDPDSRAIRGVVVLSDCEED